MTAETISNSLEIFQYPLEKINQLQQLISKNGIVFFEHEFDQDEFLEFSKQFGEIYKHRDSISNGITIVKNEIDKEKADIGHKGLTTSSLFPHTDRSSLDNPPNVLILYCKNQSGDGGESILVDVKSMINDLIKDSNIENHPIFEQNSVIFNDGKTSHTGSIIERINDGSFYLRYRNDEFGYFNSKVYPYLEKIESLILDKQLFTKLKKNQGFIINNGRFLHGRKEFQGSREMWRVLISDNFMKRKGFILEKI